MSKALVIGGTGPSGPYVVEGLIARGYDVTIMHSGAHEVDFSQDVEHLHGDVHFEDQLASMIGRRWFDIAILMYGRLRHSVQVLSDRCSHIVAVGTALGTTAPPESPQWGQVGQPMRVDERSHKAVSGLEGSSLRARMVEAEEALFSSMRGGGAPVTYLGYPRLYGPRQPGPLEWSIVRRALDKRPIFVVADGGLKVETRGYVENVAHALLLCVDDPEIGAGKKYFVGDDAVHTVKQRIEFIAAHMGHKFAIVDMPYSLATPCWALWRHSPYHSVRDTGLIRRELGYQDVVPTPEALRTTVDWLIANRLSEEDEAQLGDAFAYEAEDALVGAWKRAYEEVVQHPVPVLPATHIYRHPRKPGDPWSSGNQ